MFFFKLILFLCVCVVLQLICAQSALAWGPGVHTVIALSSLDEVGLLLPSIARMITSFPVEYLYGCLAADFFIGKGKGKKQGNPHNWEGGFKFLSEASNDREAAYAYGFLSHLAADVVAHNFFVPNLIKSYPARRRVGHLYWEIKADYLVGPGYTRVAKDVLSMDHKGCDELLELVAGKRRNGLKAKKHIYTQSIKLSDYFYATHDFLFAGKMVRWQMFHKYLAFMVDLSCRMSKNFLMHPDSSPCLLYSPLGRRNVRLAKRRRLSTKMWSTRGPI
jgi:hypothetical protein